MELSRFADDALLALLQGLAEQRYRFITPTPATHARVLARPLVHEARDLRGIFGWSLPFAPDLLPGDMHALMERAGALTGEGSLLRSKLRVSSIADRLFLHSAYPTDAEDSVFFGPDTYRFADLLARRLPGAFSGGRLVDQGTGAGVGGIISAALCPAARIVLLDINPTALRLASINARFAGVDVELVEGTDLSAVTGDVDCVIANPPYIMDDKDRHYRDGGDMHGAQLSLDWTLDATRRIRPGGCMILYTGSAIVDGRDALEEALVREVPPLGGRLEYEEIDPDVFGEELEKPAYSDVERIAIVGAVVRRG